MSAATATATAAGVAESTANPTAAEVSSSPDRSAYRTASFPPEKKEQAESCASFAAVWTMWPPPKGTPGEAVLGHGLGVREEHQGGIRAVSSD